MRPITLSNLNMGINRLRTKGGASPSSLYDLQNAYITSDGAVNPREGTVRTQQLTSVSKGLMANNGIFNVFSNVPISVPSGYLDNVLVNPNDASQAIVKIWFAKPFLGFPYVAAEFANGDVYHYWLQNGGTWAQKTIYTKSTLILPTVSTGFAYLANRVSPVNPTWTAETVIALNMKVEPTAYTGYFYKAVAVAGANPHTGASEPVWPIVAASTIQEFGDFDTSSTDAGTTQGTTTTTTLALGANITDRYGDSTTIASSGKSAGTGGTLPVIASTKVSTWTKGTLYAPGAVVQPTTSQGAFLNAIPNGDFEAGNDGNWILTAGAAFVAGGSHPYQGNECISLTASHGDESITMNTFGVVTPGKRVTATAFVNPNSSGADLSMGISLRWYNAADVFISKTDSVRYENGPYKMATVTGTAPANAAHVRVQIDGGNNTSSKTGYVDLVSWNLSTPTAVSNFLFEAVQPIAGTSGATEPTWPTTPGNTVIDNGVTWKAIGTSIITWEAIPIMQSGATEPVWPTVVGGAVLDSSSFLDANAVSEDTSISWVAASRRIADTKVHGQFTYLDPYFSSVALLLHFDGTDGQTSTVDSSLNGLAISRLGTGPTLTTTAPKFGTACSLHTSVGCWSVAVTPGSPLDMSVAGDFTVEGWVDPTSGGNEFMSYGYPGIDGFYLGGAVGGAVGAQLFKQGGGSVNIASTSLLVGGSWQHVAFVYHAGVYTMYLNGIGGTPVTAPSCTYGNSQPLFNIGGGGGGAFNYSGTIDEVRVTKGIARYTANFTPPDAPGSAAKSPIPAPYTAVALAASHVFAGDTDIVPFSAAVDPTDWTSANNAGYLPTGLNNYGDNPAEVLALYRSNLIAFNAGGYQMWQVDPDPANMALLDAQPVGSTFTQAAQSVANDLLFLTEVGVRNLGTVGANANMQIGSLGQPVDPIVTAQFPPSGTGTGTTVTTATVSMVASFSAIAPTNIGYRDDTFPPFGTLTPATFVGLDGRTYTINIILDNGVTGDNLSLALSYPNGVAPVQTGVFQSLQFKDKNSVVRTFASASATTFTSNATHATWTWNQGLGAMFTTGATYPITFTTTTATFYAPISLYYPGRGQYWLIFGPQAFVLTINGTGLKTWSRYVFPEAITDWCLNQGDLYLRTATDKVWRYSVAALQDDVGGTPVDFQSWMQWPYLDSSHLGYNTMMVGFDLVGTGQVTIQIAYREDDATTFIDSPGFATTLNVTPGYTIAVSDIVPGTPVPLPIAAPSYSLILKWAPNTAWQWQASNLYVTNMSGAGSLA